MPELYPDDATLLTLTADEATGVEYIPTGRTPYFLEFRRLVHRALLAAGRANDLRPYQSGDLTIGIRAGRYRVGEDVIDYSGAASVDVDPGETSFFWLNSTGELLVGPSLPGDRTMFIPIAQVIADGSTITSLTDLRGEAFLAAPNLASLGVTATPTRINNALASANASVTAAALNALTASPTSNADTYHRHLQVDQTVAGEAYFILYNKSGDSAANAGLVFSLPEQLADDVILLPSLEHGFLTQRFNGETFALVGSVHAQFKHEGQLTAGLTNKLIGAVPVDGEVIDVILSLGSNIGSSASTDGVTAQAKVNGTSLTTTHPKITQAAGSGFRSTARGHGTAAVVKSDGTQNVTRGDVLTLDVTRTAAGTISAEASDVVVLIVIRAAKPA